MTKINPIIRLIAPEDIRTTKFINAGALMDTMEFQFQLPEEGKTGFTSTRKAPCFTY